MKSTLLKKKLVCQLCFYFVCIVCCSKVYATNVSGNQSGTWTKANSPYILNGSITVPAGQKLIIQPGVEVRSLNYSDKFEVDGILYAVGTITDSIRFNGFANTAVADSSTNGGLLLLNSGSNTDSTVLAYVSMNKWGDKDYYTGDQAAIEIDKGIVIIRNSVISNSELRGIYGYNDLTKIPVITGVVFNNNPVPMYFFTDNVSGISGCTNAAINLQGGTFTKASTIPQPGANSYYILDKGSQHYFNNAKLTIQPGVEIRSMNYADKIEFDGTSVLSAIGTAVDSIRFRGFADPSTTGSSNGGFININSTSTTDSTVMAYLSVDRMGDEDYYTGDQTAIELDNGKCIIRNSLISNSELQGILGYNDLAVTPVISGVVFVNNPISVRVFSDNAGGISNCTNAYVNLQGGTFTRASTISKPGPGSYYILDKGSQHYFNAKLIIQPGVEIHSMSYADKIGIGGAGVLSAIGTATDSIRFKGYPDPTTPKSNNGGFIDINSTNTADSTVFAYMSMNAMGDKDYYTGDQTAIEIENGKCTVRNSLISNSEWQGILGYNDLAATPVISGVTFVNNPIPVRIFTDNAGAITNCTNALINLQGGTFTHASTISKPGIGSYYILDKGSQHYFTAGRLTIQPGVEIHSMNYADKIELDDSSVLSAAGSITDSIRFRGFADATTAKSTSGGLIIINSSGTMDSSVMKYVSVNNWGDKDYYTGDQAAIEIDGGNFVMRNSLISNSELQGIYGYNDLAVNPIISGVTFVNNPIPVRLYSDNAGAISNCTNAVINLIGGSFAHASTISKPGTGSYYILDKGSQHYFTAGRLTIQPGVEIHSMNYADKISVTGASVIYAKGTETDSIWFKGFPDPTTTNSSHGGFIDINSTGTSDSSVFAYVGVDRMGDKDYYTGDQTAIELENGILHINNSSIRNSELKGIYGYGDATHLTVLKSNIFNNKYGAVFNSGKPSLTRSNIYGNAVYGIQNLSGATLDTVEARTNWWGDSTGPKQSSTNPNGKGNAITLKVRYRSFLLSPYQVNDIGAAAVTAPASGCGLASPQQVKVRITNYGSKTQTGFNISYRVNSGAVVTENVGTLSLASDSTVTYAFKTLANLSTPGTTYTIKVFTALTGDTIKVNDTAKAVVINEKPNLGKDTTVNICAGSYRNITTLYNTASYVQPVSWSTTRPDSVVAGIYTLMVTNSYGCKDTAVVTVGNNPKPNLGNDTTVKICAGSYTNIKTLYDTTGTTPTWSVARPDSVVAGTYNLYVTNSYGCKDTAVITVANNPKPNLGNDTTVKICTGTYISIRGLYDTTGYVTVKYSTPKPDSVSQGNYTLIVTNTYGCADTANIKVDTLPSPAKPVLTKTGNTTFCLSDSLGLSTSSTGTMQWYRNNSAIKQATTNKYEVKLAGNYKLQLSNSGSCTVFSDSVVVHVTVVPKPTITLLNDSLVSSSSTGNQWFESSTLITGATGQKYSPVNIDVYEVQVTSGGCKSAMSDQFFYTANTLTKYRMPGNMQALMYPNPAVNEANLLVSGKGGKVLITVTDITGKVVLKTEGVYNTIIKLPVQNLANGMYIVTINDGKEISSLKLLREK